MSLIVKKGSFFLDLNFGSQIHDIKSTSTTDLNLLKSCCSASLQWLITIKKVKSFDIKVLRYDAGVVSIAIAANLFDNKKVTYEHYLRVI